jgi:hypothetical protein
MVDMMVYVGEVETKKALPGLANISLATWQGWVGTRWVITN